MLDVRRIARRTGGLVSAGMCVLMLSACGGTSMPQAEGAGGGAVAGGGPAAQAGAAQPRPVTLATGPARHGSGVIASGGPGAPYNYAPSVMQAGGTYRMWWCSQLPGEPRPGDQVLYAQSGSLDGRFTAPDGSPATEVFENSPSGFDGLHTCDPSVIAVNGTYYLYYTGTSDPNGRDNAIGLATSPDGLHWSRANGGRPIVTASGDNHRAGTYGAGQPSALYLDGWFYLMFTDTTGQAAGPAGNGQFVLRSPDPTFASNVQALGDHGFVPVQNTHATRQRSILDATTSDWMWSDALNAFVLAQDGAGGGNGTTITFWDPNFTYHPYQPVVIGGATAEGPGLVRRADGHAPISPADPCGQVAVDVVRATTNGSGPTGLSHFGVAVTGVHGCATTAQAEDVLNGFAMPSPDRTVYLLVNGHYIEIERRSVAVALAPGMLGRPLPILADVPVEAHLNAAAPAITAPGRAVGAVLDDGKLWIIGSAPASLNGSPVTAVLTERWDDYPVGGDLTSLRS